MNPYCRTTNRAARCASAFVTVNSFPQATGHRFACRGTGNICSHHGFSVATASLVPLKTGIEMEVLESIPSNGISRSSSKPPLVFVHGTLHAAWCFEKFFQPFFASHGFSSYAVSLRNAGNTVVEKVEKTTISQHIADLQALVDELKLASPVILGHSLGGFIVQKWVAENSNLFGGMVLLSSSPPSGNSKLVKRISRKKGLWATIRYAFVFVFRTMVRDLSICREMLFSSKDIEGFSEELEGDDVLREYMELLKKTDLKLDVKGLNDPVSGAGSIGGKVFVIGGSADNVVDVEALYESKEFWNGEIMVVEDGPHDLMLSSQWEATANHILGWLHKLQTEDVSRSTDR